MGPNPTHKVWKLLAVYLGIVHERAITMLGFERQLIYRWQESELPLLERPAGLLRKIYSWCRTRVLLELCRENSSMVPLGWHKGKARLNVSRQELELLEVLANVDQFCQSIEAPLLDF